LGRYHRQGVEEDAREWVAPMNGMRLELSNGVEPRTRGYVWATLFALYLAFALVSAAVLHGVFVPFVHLAQLINIQLGRSAANSTGGYTAFFIFVIGLTILLVGLFRLLGRMSGMGQLLRYSALVTMLAAAPVCWFYVARWHGWFPLEVVGFIALMIVLAIAGWRPPFAMYIVLFALHFGFWGLQFWHFTHNPAGILFPFAGFCASLAWVSWLPFNLRRRNNSPEVIS
jgi:hypothetical protein